MSCDTGIGRGCLSHANFFVCHTVGRSVDKVGSQQYSMSGGRCKDSGVLLTGCVEIEIVPGTRSFFLSERPAPLCCVVVKEEAVWRRRWCFTWFSTVGNSVPDFFVSLGLSFAA